MNAMNATHECVIDVLIAEAGMTRAEACGFALEYTCYPMDCEQAVHQARAWIAAPRAYIEQYYAELERERARGLEP